MKKNFLEVGEIFIGAWLIFSPWILGFSSPLAIWSNLIMGGALVLINLWVLFGGEEKVIARPKDFEKK